MSASAGWCWNSKVMPTRSSAASAGRKSGACAWTRRLAMWSRGRGRDVAVRVKIPTPLRGLTGDADTVSVESGTLAEAVGQLEGAYPGMRERLCDDTGALRRFVNVYINGEDV